MPNFAAWEHPLPPRDPLLHPRGLPGHCSGHGKEMRAVSYLSRLGRGMEPEPDPSIPFFPLNNFSTRATFPVRAASSSSCSFPIPDTSLQRRGDANPTDLPYILLPSDPFPHWLVWESIRKGSSHCMLLHGGIGVIDAAEEVWRALLPRCLVTSVRSHARLRNLLSCESADVRGSPV